MPGTTQAEAVSDYAPYRPSAALRPFVSWGTGYRQAGLEPASHRGLPSPWLTLIVTLDEPLVITAHPDPGQPPSAHDFLLGGLRTAPATVTHEGRQSGIQLGLTPLGARALLGVPAAELASIDVEATDVLGALATRVRERVLAEAGWPGRFAALEAFLARRVQQATGTETAGAGSPGAGRLARARPEVSYAWRRLRDSRGSVSVSGLAAETGWSARHLGAQFRAETGLSPKEAARVIRFDRARRLLAGWQAGTQASGQAGTQASTARPGTLADLAAECGFYDQAHLARDFRDLAGCPPSQWMAEEFRYVQAAPHGDWE
jgi:AraC-like DNA-binding protein